MLGRLQEALWRLRSSEDHPGSFKYKTNEESVMILIKQQAKKSGISFKAGRPPRARAPGVVGHSPATDLHGCDAHWSRDAVCGLQMCLCGVLLMCVEAVDWYFRGARHWWSATEWQASKRLPWLEELLC